ncbi:NACHT domain-containing protein [Scytonema sp. UIC 10036]|uniref:NACHT domain-containing protein n=1 Tax=Scytonema sp. UIC 10036 TaxID=2304196 RepID=UPI0012DA6D8F|nr:NACHT domain-containing protein [Scytonema sp. UIC 10036]MUG99209.1 NACHT domain-containing protein [Scytonema sp. UIC 10036]
MVQKILILAANPKTTQPLELDLEIREIESGLRRSLNREEFVIEKHLAVRTEDLRRTLLDVEPRFVHFCGHGTGDEGIVLEDTVGYPQLVKAEPLANLFKLFSNQIECAILNACYSDIQAQAISEHINYVIGMRQGVGDRTAINFAVGFYDAIGAGRTIEEAFEFGKNAIELNSLSEERVPVLLKKSHLTVISSTSTSVNIDALVQEMREKIKPYIKERCNTMRVLDMTKPIVLGDIYAEVNIEEKNTRRNHEQVSALQAIEQHGKLMVLGKPGAGKTTFLKYLAIQCIEGQFQSDRIPIFITLKDFAEESKQPDIVEYIAGELSKCKVKDAAVKTEQLLEQGKVLVLLDGFDEVREKDNSRIIKKIREFSQQFSDNKIIITCRNAATNYIFEKFVDVEVVNFNEGQIKTFANQWFYQRKSGKAENFIQELEKNQPIKKLATNPLILTLLCLIFEKKGEFKNNRSELYEELLNFY